MEAALKIINEVDKQTVNQLTASIISILKSPGDQETIRHALTTLSNTVAIKNVSIANNKFAGERNITVEGDD